jgi:hypothetical protein
MAKILCAVLTRFDICAEQCYLIFPCKISAECFYAVKYRNGQCKQEKNNIRSNKFFQTGDLFCECRFE